VQPKASQGVGNPIAGELTRFVGGAGDDCERPKIELGQCDGPDGLETEHGGHASALLPRQHRRDRGQGRIPHMFILTTVHVYILK